MENDTKITFNQHALCSYNNNSFHVHTPERILIDNQAIKYTNN